jgi:3-isopropylmalate dehydrogenase
MRDSGEAIKNRLQKTISDETLIPGGRGAKSSFRKDKEMKVYSIVVIPGDGIGPELVEATLKVLDKVQELAGDFRLSHAFHDAGANYFQKHGRNISPETLEAIRLADATMKGPVGLPGVRLPDGTEAGVLGGVLRSGFDLYANVRPIRLFPKVAAPLRDRAPESIDYVVVRENTEGLYLSRGRGLMAEQAASDTLLLTRKGCERICRFAFKLAADKARGAPEDGVKRVTLVEKSNVLRSFYFFRQIFAEVARGFPQVEAESLYVDAAAAALVLRPQHFQVIVTENMFGDILSDLGGATIGGLGMCPSSNRGDQRAYFEPIHGSAPDLVGKHKANPLSQILAAAMMLDYLGRKKDSLLLEKAVWKALEEERFRISSDGLVEGGSQAVAAALQEELERCYGEEKP